MTKWREEIIGDCRLILGDCREVLPTLGPVDAVVTDPPFGMSRDGKPKSTSSHGGHKGYESKGWDNEKPSLQVFQVILNLSVPTAIWGGNYFSNHLPVSSKWLVWDKGQRISQADAELCWTSEAGALRIMTLNRVELMVDGAEHPTQKPVRLMEWTLAQIKAEGTVLDPFAGSGSTGVAAMRRECAFIGIEREPSYFDTACRRIEAAYRQPRLFAEPVVKPVQEALDL